MTFIQALRTYILVGFLSLPLLLIGFTGVFAIGLTNLALGFLFLCQTTAIPLSVFLLQTIHSVLFGRNPHVSVPASDVCGLVPSVATVAASTVIAPSYWITHVVFFFVYLFYNAFQLYNLPAEEGAAAWKIENRKNKSMAGMIMSIAILLVALGARLILSRGCETAYGAILSVALGAALAIAAFEVGKLCGVKMSDIYGVAMQFLPASAKEAPPTMCMYTKPPA